MAELGEDLQKKRRELPEMGRESMGVLIPDDVLQAIRITAEELKQEIAVRLFQKEKLTLSQGSCLAGMNRLPFQHLLASRGIPVHYDTAAGDALYRPVPGRRDVVSQIARLGMRPDDITHVINSHLHVDHCGGHECFSQATCLVQSREMARARSPDNPYNPQDFDHPLNYHLIDGDYDLFGDGTLVLLPTYGHIPSRRWGAIDVQVIPSAAGGGRDQGHDGARPSHRLQPPWMGDS
jgi:predicted HTH domain antitoxin